jgi:hypothetical protein
MATWRALAWRALFSPASMIASSSCSPQLQLGHARLLTERAHHLRQRQRRPHRPLGVILARHRRPPDGHDRVADELLHRAAVAGDHGAAAVEVAAQ